MEAYVIGWLSLVIVFTSKIWCCWESSESFFPSSTNQLPINGLSAFWSIQLPCCCVFSDMAMKQACVAFREAWGTLQKSTKLLDVSIQGSTERRKGLELAGLQ